MKKYFIVADVHGHYYEMYAALTKVGFSPHNNDHIFISLVVEEGDFEWAKNILMNIFAK